MLDVIVVRLFYAHSPMNPDYPSHNSDNSEPDSESVWVVWKQPVEH